MTTARREGAPEADRPPERSWLGLYRVSGILGAATGIMGFLFFIGGLNLYSAGYPSTPEAYLQLVSRHQGSAYGLWSLWDVNDFLSFAPTAAAYLIFRHYNKTLALLGSLVVGFYLFYDIGVTELNSMTLVSLSQGYAVAGTAALKAAYLAAATYGYSALQLQTVLSFGVGSVGWLFLCIPMAKSAFGRGVAGLGVVANIIGIIGAAATVLSSSAFTWSQLLAPPLIGLWGIVVGVKLYRNRREFAELDTGTMTAGPTSPVS